MAIEHVALSSPKMRSKVGFHRLKVEMRLVDPKTIKEERTYRWTPVASGLEFLGWSASVLEPAAVRGLLGAIAADRHAAPSSRSPPRVVGKHQGAAMSLARFDIGEVFLAHKFPQRFADRQQ